MRDVGRVADAAYRGLGGAGRLELLEVHAHPGGGGRGHLGDVYGLVGSLILDPIAGGADVLPLGEKAD